MFSKCAQKVLFLNKYITSENHAHVACALSYSYFMQNLVSANIIAMQKLVFTYPGNIESWAMFIAVFLSRFVNEFRFLNFLINFFIIKIFKISIKYHKISIKISTFINIFFISFTLLLYM